MAIVWVLGVADCDRPVRARAEVNLVCASRQFASIDLVKPRLGIYQHNRLPTWHTFEIDSYRVCIFNKEHKVLLVGGDQAVSCSSLDATIIREHVQFQSPLLPKFPVRVKRQLDSIGICYLGQYSEAG